MEFSLLENIREAPTLLLQIVAGGELEWKLFQTLDNQGGRGGGELFLVRHAKYQY